MTKRAFNPDDVFDLKCSGDAHLSPDSRSVAYVTQYHDKSKEKSFTDIYLASVETAESRRLTTSGKDRSPRWSPDGRRIAFVSDRSGKAQIWVIDVGGGEAWRIPTKQAVQGDPVWSPDGSRIFFTASAFAKPEDWVPYPGAPGDDRQRAVDQANRALSPKSEGAQDGKPQENGKPNDIKVVTRLRYRMDGMGYFGDLRRQVFSVPVPDFAPEESAGLGQQLTSGDYDHNSPCVTPCGKYVVVSATREDDADFRQESDLWLFEVASLKAHLLYDSPGPANSPRVSPDGKYVAFLGHDRKRGHSTRTDLWLLPIGDFMEAVSGGGSPAPLTVNDALNLTARFDRQAGGMAGAEPRYGGMGPSVNWDGSTLYFTLEDHGEVFIYSASGPVWTPSKALGQVGRPMSGYDVRNGVFAYQSSTATSPEDVFVLKDRAEKRLTNANDDFMAGIATGNSEKFTYLAGDGLELDGWVIYPHGYQAGQKYPTVLLVHGGPHGAYSSAFMWSGQFFASHGYAVIYCNPRGSTSYGQEFMACIDGDWGNKDYTDVMSCVDAAVNKGFVDERNVFLHGWSYGGYWTVWAVTQTGRFKAACAGACVSNMHSDYGTSDIMWADEHEYGGKPWEDADLLLDRSALSHVQDVTTPILLLHGENDLRCPISQTEQFYVGLRRLGKTAVMVRYPEEYHGLRRPLHRIDRYRRMLAWFDYYRQR